MMARHGEKPTRSFGEAIAGERVALRELLDVERETGEVVTMEAVACGVVALAHGRPEQARLLAWMFWELSVEQLAQLLRARRTDTITALWRWRERGRIADAARHFGQPRSSIWQTTQRARRNLGAQIIAGFLYKT